jgi:hypothetical protein
VQSRLRSAACAPSFVPANQVGFFDVWFKGSEANPADNDIRLSTAPDPTGASLPALHGSVAVLPACRCARGRTRRLREDR